MGGVAPAGGAGAAEGPRRRQGRRGRHARPAGGRGGGGGAAGARSHRRVALPLVHFIPCSRIYSVPLSVSEAAMRPHAPQRRRWRPRWRRWRRTRRRRRRTTCARRRPSSAAGSATGWTVLHLFAPHTARHIKRVITEQGEGRRPRLAQRPAGRQASKRARSHCRAVPPLTHVIPDSLTYSVPPSLKRQCDRTP